MIYITFISEILPLIFCILFYKKLNSKALKVFFIYTIVLSLFVILSTLSVYVFKSRIFYFYIIRSYTIVEYLLFAKFLYHVYNNSIAKKIIYYSVFPFIFYCIIDFVSNKSSFSNYPSLIEFLAFISFIIYFFYEKMKTVVQYPLYQSISFWICVGLFLYFTGNFFFFLFVNSSSDQKIIGQMKIIYSIVTISKNILLSCAFFASEIPEKQNVEFELPSELNLDSFAPNNNLN